MFCAMACFHTARIRIGQTWMSVDILYGFYHNDSLKMFCRSNMKSKWKLHENQLYLFRKYSCYVFHNTLFLRIGRTSSLDPLRYRNSSCRRRCERTYTYRIRPAELHITSLKVFALPNKISHHLSFMLYNFGHHQRQYNIGIDKHSRIADGVWKIRLNRTLHLNLQCLSEHVCFQYFDSPTFQSQVFGEKISLPLYDLP